MGGLFRKICAYLCKPIYLLIVYMYKIFYNIATTRFLNSDIMQQFSANIYTLVSVVMLFAFSITILSAIVNPDLLSDNKKGVKALFKRAIIALVLMVVIPFAFDELYAIQENVMSNSLIEKIVVGISYDCEGSDDTNCAGGNGGQVISGTLISSVIRPEEKYMNSDGSISIDKTAADAYKKMVSEDISYIGIVAKNINVTVDDVDGKDVTDDDAYAFHFDELIAIAAGIATIYILVLFSIDVAVRVFKLAFLELTAPISIVSYVAAGDKILSSWFKELGKTYAELFIRVAAIAFYLFLIKNLNSLMESFTSADWSFVLKAFIMIGMLIFAKQIPDLIGKIFGIEIKSQGGIAGRLGSMAGVGNVAKGALQGLTNIAKATPLLAGAGIGALAGKGAGLLGSGLSKAGGWLGQTAVGQKVNGNATVQKVKSAATKASSFANNLGSNVKSGIKNATTAVNAAAHESNPFKAYDKLRYSEGGMGAVKKENKEYLENKKEKAKANASLSEKIGSNILDSDGNVVNATLATPTAYKSMIKKMDWTDQQKDAAIKYNETQNALLTAQSDNQKINQIRSAIENKMNSSSTGTQKAALANVLSNMDLGTYQNSSQLEQELQFALRNDKNAGNFVTNISSTLNGMSSNNLGSIASYSSNIDAAQEAFSRADSTLNDVIDKATSGQKVILKEARTASKKMNEANVK